MGENTTGDIRLEVIAEDTLIEPWQSDFMVHTAKKVTVEVKSQKEKKSQIKESTKPQIKIKNVKNDFNPINEMVDIFIKNGITLNKVIKDKKRITPILENYSNKVNYQGGTKKFIREVIQKLSKE